MNKFTAFLINEIILNSRINIKNAKYKYFIKKKYICIYKRKREREKKRERKRERGRATS